MPAKPPLSSRFGKWFALQVAGKAVGLALGAPAVSAAVTAVLAYLQGLPLAYAFLSVMLVAASTTVIMNQVRTFILAYSPLNKVLAQSAGTFYGSTDAGTGYGVYVTLTNRADVPMEFQATRELADVNGALVRRAAHATKGDIIEAGGTRIHILGAAVMDPIPDSDLRGRVEFAFHYGRPGNLNCETTFLRDLAIRTGPDGMPSVTNPFVV